MTHAVAINMPALGRPFSLGMLYDCRTDQLIPGMTLWNPGQLRDNITITPQPATDFEMIMEDSLENKARALNVEAELKLSAMCGLCKVSGSAKYMNDRTSSSRQSRISLQFKSTSRFEMLSMDHLGRSSTENRHVHVFDDDIATHVVTGITYGADAIMVFDCTASTADETTELKGKLTAQLNFVVGEVKGGIEMSLKNKEDSVTNSTKCTFYSDFASKKNPANFQDAVALYKELPSLCGENGQKAVPKSVYLYPLSKLDSKGQQIVRGISEDLVDQIMQTLESMHSVRMTTSDLLSYCADGSNSVQNKFLHLREEIQEVIHALTLYELKFKRQILPVLPKIRGGAEEESVLCDMLTAHNQSPFCVKSLQKWAEKKKREIELLEGYLKVFSQAGITFCAKDSELDKFVNHMNTPTVFALAFCVNEMLDPEVKGITSYVASTASSKKNASEKHWFENAKQLKSTRAEINRFTKAWKEIQTIQQSGTKHSCNVKFVVCASQDTSLNVVKAVLYEDGIAEDFIWPMCPLDIKCVEATSDTLSISWEKEHQTPASCQHQVLKYRIRSLFGCSPWTELKVNPDVKSKRIPNLLPKTEYEIVVRAITQLGFGADSDVFGPVATAVDEKSARSFVPKGSPKTIDIVESAVFARIENYVNIYTIIPQENLAYRRERFPVFEIGKFAIMKFPAEPRVIVMGLEEKAEQQFQNFLRYLVNTVFCATEGTDVTYEIHLADILRMIDTKAAMAEIRIYPSVFSPIPFTLRILVFHLKSKIEYWNLYEQFDCYSQFVLVSPHVIRCCTHDHEKAYDEFTEMQSAYCFKEYLRQRPEVDCRLKWEALRVRQGYEESIKTFLETLRNIPVNETTESDYFSMKATWLYHIALLSVVRCCLDSHDNQAETEFVLPFPEIVSERSEPARYICQDHPSPYLKFSESQTVVKYDYAAVESGEREDEVEALLGQDLFRLLSDPSWITSDFSKFHLSLHCAVRTRNWDWLQENIFFCKDASWLIQEGKRFIELREKVALESLIQLVLKHRLIWEGQKLNVPEPYPYTYSDILTALLQEQTDKTTRAVLEKVFLELQPQLLLELGRAQEEKKSLDDLRYYILEQSGSLVSLDTLMITFALRSVQRQKAESYATLETDFEQRFPDMPCSLYRSFPGLRVDDLY